MEHDEISDDEEMLRKIGIEITNILDGLPASVAVSILNIAIAFLIKVHWKGSNAQRRELIEGLTDQLLQITDSVEHDFEEE